MGAAVEGWDPGRIGETHGVLERLLPYRHYVGRNESEWDRPPGTTENGIERQRLVATAIIEKKGRIKAHDLVRVWLRDLDPARMRWKQEAFDVSLLELARAGVPPSELGRLWPYPNVVSVARSTHPLALVNAGDPEAAADDTFEVGSVYCAETSFGLRWAALYNAAVAEAAAPGSTVEAVLDTALRFSRFRAEAGNLYSGYDTIEREVRRALELAARHDDPFALRDEFYGLYAGGDYLVYGQSQANEIVSKGLAVFSLTRGDPREAIVAAVNFGRDTDCLAAVAGGLAGALSGAGAIPPEWIGQVDKATAKDPYTNSKRTVDETADGLLEAFRARRRGLEEYLARTSD
jgi:ADP-ribosylglycohydrolase